jgi:D-tyrosyl-tRNA(Tyr) deacylase
MRAVVQRVSSACVRAAGEEVARMEAGLLALVGVGLADGDAEARDLARRLVHLRVLPDAQGRMNRSLLEAGGTLGVVSQFTLFGDARHGRRPSYGAAAPAERAEPLIDALVAEARSLGAHVVTGRFRTQMEVALVGDGPVTILIDTEKRF